MNEKGIRDASPCKDCTRRELGCHDICKDYIDWKANLQKARKEEHNHMPPIIRGCDFTGTSPKPGHHRRTRGAKR